ncbi:MAG TPA: TfoX/Sxy family protein [Burkholderiales bacterium]|nr:TfoX/Sxy family protein [Burkholderiales bacterium]
MRPSYRLDAPAADEAMDYTQRMRAALRGKRVKENAMFGGVCFMLRDHMLCATSPRGYLFRVGKEQSAAALARPGARIMEMNDRRYEGYVRVDPDQCDARALRAWLAMAEKHVAALPPKTSRARAGR